EIDAYRPLGTLGVDSLMAMDLRMGLEERLGRTIPLFDAGGEITIADLCQRLLDSMEHADAEPDDPRDEDERVVEVLAQRHLKDGSGTLDRAMVAQIAGTKRRSLG
ncbi:MAG: acyl carrier protein, partial [Pseudomonadota bacterium]